MGDRPQRLMLLDTASLYFRAFFGIPDKVKAPDGTSVNAVRGLLDFIAKLVTTYEATHLVACWDDDWRPQWRVDLIPSYKGHRVVAPIANGVDIEQTPDPLDAQVPIIREVLEALDIAVVGAPGYEADDVIGTLATKAGMPVDVVTGDRDLIQLVSDEEQVRIVYTARGMSNLEVVTDGVVVGKYGILPEQYADFAAMRGDPSDGLPGVQGVGDKTAASLLQQYGDLDGIIAAAGDPSTKMASGLRGKLLAADDYLKVAPTVVAVARDLDLVRDGFEIEPLIPESLALVTALQNKWNLGGSVTRVLPALHN
jgi:5'-3' exonuclease